MKKTLTAISAAALLAASSLAALAAEASGAITSVDVSAGQITIDDGSTFFLPPSVDAAALQVGQQVIIEYEQGADGSLNAMSVEPAS
ncbi:DUF1344 domain-containing protein [Bauldia sp.]|uniref:DUF1344 domain-containing protein n=1 Tax=Bauldia sp. TaxID=2575872 RepID=UPI003BA92021